MRRMFVFTVLALLLATAPVTAQVELVADVKKDLVDRRVIPNPQRENCDAFQILARVAWQLREQGAHLFRKTPGQNGCTWNGQRYSHDAIAFPTGWADILESAGPPANVNGPQWDWEAAVVAVHDRALFAAPFNLDPAPPIVTPPVIVPVPIPQPPAPSPQPLPTVDLCTAQIALLRTELAAVNANITEGRTENRNFFQRVAGEWKRILGVAALLVGGIVTGAGVSK